ncbi:MAG TPA: hypothetical protein VJ085_04825 [Candidatus Acidoferrales bacterium]|nr:hypothetical protein [Candidatus Acidoferrales bacterium]
MKLLQTWDTIRTTVEEFSLPPYLEKTAQWLERHPRAVIAGTLVVVMAALLTQIPAENPVEPDAYNGETPLFV